MREIFGGDLWAEEADCLVIPICWVRKRNDDLVMGAGVAKDAAARRRGLARIWGAWTVGRAPYVMFIDDTAGGPVFAGFPTKRDWHDRSDLDLIEQSARELAEVANLRDWQTVALPRVGCGDKTGRRDWESEVKPILEQYLDDKFVVVSQDHQRAPSAGIEGE